MITRVSPSREAAGFNIQFDNMVIFFLFYDEVGDIGNDNDDNNLRYSTNKVGDAVGNK